MKKIMTIAITAGLLSSSLVYAATELKADHPCRKIATTCEAAGFVKGKGSIKQGKNLWKDCVNPLMQGKTVAGVAITQDDVQACKAKRAERHK